MTSLQGWIVLGGPVVALSVPRQSLLRHRAASSPIEDFGRPRFSRIIPDNRVSAASRILVCTGKIGHELRRAREDRHDTSIAIVSIGQLNPFPSDEVGAEFRRHSGAQEIVGFRRNPQTWVLEDS